MTYLFDLLKCIKFMITYILQYEIPFRVQFLNLGHDPLFWVMTLLTSYHPRYNLSTEKHNKIACTVYPY